MAPATVPQVYTVLDTPDGHKPVVIPVNVNGADKVRFNITVFRTLLAQVVFDLTERFPLVKEGAKITEIVFAPVVAAGIVTGETPLTDVTPTGKIHV